mmetsp:Transcript_39582/g.102479  ORF Transcript_39582/g.102479 Transcript_39582/m.102479 type:complete len:214 (+) Transcript_39582:1184-1825(+)
MTRPGRRSQHWRPCPRRRSWWSRAASTSSTSTSQRSRAAPRRSTWRRRATARPASGRRRAAHPHHAQRCRLPCGRQASGRQRQCGRRRQPSPPPARGPRATQSSWTTARGSTSTAGRWRRCGSRRAATSRMYQSCTCRRRIWQARCRCFPPCRTCSGSAWSRTTFRAYPSLTCWRRCSSSATSSSAPATPSSAWRFSAATCSAGCQASAASTP